MARWAIPPAAALELHDIMVDAIAWDNANTAEQPMSETAISKRVRLEAANLGCHTWRNNSGAMRTRDGRFVRFGLGNESAAINAVMKTLDLIGIGPAGRFLAIEVKKPGWRYTGTARELAQSNFMRTVRGAGGVAFFASSVEDVKRGLMA